ncbi:hypothetical protein [Nonomuraea polychroma]|uniref:hypothetical protein n=1 Tax=Nonomuraea polychroma TaxID=46176 RepID=UPI000FDD7EEE|nr:hypothetical protein [Nonomuraea polychroma]
MPGDCAIIPSEYGPSQLRQVARLLDRMSIVVIRIRNSGSYDIDPDDFERPLSFTFGGRLVWKARVSDASTDKLREQPALLPRGGPTRQGRPRHGAAAALGPDGPLARRLLRAGTGRRPSRPGTVCGWTGCG